MNTWRTYVILGVGFPCLLLGLYWSELRKAWRMRHVDRLARRDRKVAA